MNVPLKNENNSMKINCNWYLLQIVESPPGEVSFKTETMTPQMIEQQARLLAKRDIIKNSSVVISPNTTTVATLHEGPLPPGGGLEHLAE